MLPRGSAVEPQLFSPLCSPDTTNQPMWGTNLKTSRVMLLRAALSMLAAVLAVGRDRREGRIFDYFAPPKRAPLCGFTTRANRSHWVVCTDRAVKAVQIAKSGLLASRELAEQELKIENLTPFSFLSLSPAGAVTATNSLQEMSSSMGNMYLCCFGPMLLALLARLRVVKIQVTGMAVRTEAAGDKGGVCNGVACVCNGVTCLSFV